MKTAAASLLVVLAVGVPPTAAHPVPAARAVIDIDGGDYEIAIDCDVAALVMQAPPGHLGDERADELRAMSDKQLQGWVGDARKALTARSVIEFDGRRVEPMEIIFPEPAQLRKQAQGHNTAETTGRVVVRGKVPAGARSVALTFSPDLGPVRLTVRRGREALHTLRLEPGKGSEALALVKESAPEVPRTSGLPFMIVAGAGVVCFVGLAVGMLWRRRGAG